MRPAAVGLITAGASEVEAARLPPMMDTAEKRTHNPEIKQGESEPNLWELILWHD
jgi:hypothetical protein